MPINENDYVGFGIDPVTGKRHEINHLPVMDEWEPGIYQHEQGDKIIGGIDGIANLPLQQLANRTEYLKKAIAEKSSAASFSVTIAPAAWVWDAEPEGEYSYHADVVNEIITEDMTPFLAFAPASLTAAHAVGVCPSARTLAGSLRVYAKSAPTEAMTGTLTLLSPASEILVDDDFATDEEVTEALDEAWGGN
ncbi:MAG: hypothetical protein IJR68_11320 [Fretibacterium sp.]|nr:hypothetical protein [Fretibacterium sp.]